MNTLYKVITLCGSSKFESYFLKLNEKLSIEGNIVLMPTFFHCSEYSKDLNAQSIKTLKNLHLKRIDLADEILVINVNGYIGESTKLEIEYAKSLNKKVNYLEN